MTAARVSVWPPLPLDVYGRTLAPALPFPLEEPGCRVFARARHGLWQGVQALGLEPGDRVLVPAYHHGSEVEALLQAGLEPRFYAGTPSLEPDPDELDSLLDPRVRALHLTHYLGFPQDGPRWRAWCDERGVFLLEDAAQAWLATRDGAPVGAVGDVSVFCLYKTVGVPDGGAMLVRDRAPGPESARPLGAAPAARRHVLALVQVNEAAAALAGRLARPKPYDPREDFALGDPGAATTSATLFLVPRLADGHAAPRRRANFSLLLDELADLVPDPFGTVSAGAAPFAFPVASEDKRALLARLREHGVAAFDFWSEPHPSLPVDGFPAAAERRRTTVALPVHQELRLEDLERIVAAVRPPRSRRSSFRLERVHSLEDVRSDWEALAEASGNIFATWEWASTWWRHFGAGKRLLVHECRSPGGELVALLPLYLYSPRPLRVVRLLGHGPADLLGPVCAPAARGIAARALRRALVETAPDVFLGEQLAGGDGWARWLGGAVVRREGNPILRIDGKGWDGLLAAWSANLRQQVRRLERKLAKDHTLSYRLADDRERLAEDLATLFRLHAARWGTDRSSFSAGERAFHEDFATRAFERGWLRLWFLELDGRPVAAWHGFRFAGSESYYQAGRDPGWEGPPLGFVLLAHTIRAAAEDGMREYRFLRGSEGFKYRFADRDDGLETVAVPRGAVGRAALATSGALPGHVILSLLRRLPH